MPAPKIEEVKEQPKQKWNSSQAKTDPFASKIKYQYKKFDPWPDYYYKYTEKCTQKTFDFHHIDFEANHADMEFV